MASLGPGNYGVVVLPVGDSKASDFKLVLQREPRTCRTWYLAGLILPNEEPIDAAIRESFKESGLAMTAADLTLPIMFECRYLLGSIGLSMCVSAFVHVPYVIANLRTPAKVE
jgi:hypothetical protein